MDADGNIEGLTRLRDRYDAKLQMLEECERAIRSLEAPIQDLRVKHADHNHRHYEYLDVSKATLNCNACRPNSGQRTAAVMKHTQDAGISSSTCTKLSRSSENSSGNSKHEW